MLGKLGNIKDLATNSFKDLLNQFRKPEKINYKGEDFADGLEVTEITNLTTFSSKTGGNTIYLKGTRLPKQPFAWGGSQRIIKEYYPGNPEPAVQVLGSREENVTLEGRWRDQRTKVTTNADLKNPDKYGVSYRLQEYFDALRRRGNLIYMRLGEWERYGYIEETNFQMKTIGHIEWKIVFSVISRTKPEQNFFATTLQQVPLDTNILVAVAATNISTDAFLALPVPTSLLGSLQNAIASLAAKIKTVTQFVDGVLGAAENTVAQVNRAISLIKGLRGDIARYKRRMGQLTMDIAAMPSTFSHAERRKWVDVINLNIYQSLHAPSRPTRLTTTPPVRSYLSSESSITQGQNIRETPSLETLLKRLETQLLAIQKTLPLARYRVRQGDTLAKLAFTYYKNSELWQRIYTHNKLTSTDLVVGTLLEIPKL